MLKIAVDSGPLGSGDSVRGIGVYTRELLKALNLYGVDVSDVDLNGYDVIHLTRFHPFFVSVPYSKPKGARLILTIYDLIPLIYPEHYPPGIKGTFRFLINKYLIKKNVDAIITISETSKKDICRFLGVNPNMVYVTYLSPRPIFRRLKTEDWKKEIIQKYKLPDDYVLYVGDLNFNKNIVNLIEGCRIAKKPLVIVGKQAAEVNKMDFSHPELKHLATVDWSKIIRLGFVSDADLVAIYNLASVYIQPSYYEGFGLPLLEAVSCKTPVAVSKNQCHVEILGNDFDYFNADEPDDIAKYIISPNRDRKLPRNYSWKLTAKETLKIYESE